MHDVNLEPLRAVRLKDAFLERFERLILSGELAPGDRLPPERDLAVRLGVSRPVVHEALLELEARGLVTVLPRQGTRVNDFRREGSLALLESVFRHRNGAWEAGLLRDTLALRRVIETEAARQAAENRGDTDVRTLHAVLEREDACAPRDVATLVALDFELHHEVAMASGNRVYPMLLKSFEPTYVGLGTRFFRDEGVVARVHGTHRELVLAIAARDVETAGAVMGALLDHGAAHLLAREPHSATPGKRRHP